MPTEQPHRDIFFYIGPRLSWLPTYNLDQLLEKAFRESPFSSNMMEAGYAQSEMLNEYRAIVEISSAFNRVHHKNSLYEAVNRSQSEIDEALRSNDSDNYPSYSRLLDLLIQRGVLVRREPATD
ncbi:MULTISPECIES: hypothetical protein [Mesorhizobium]|uniref:hypothetical protein n=1 Tax=Mesorhizobium TaxID=68287 RepID=UPI0010A961E0|nr:MULTISPECIES: hypothetical protein [Mesorhizobium]